ncbi:DUF5063 domain-containing protein [Gottfriedia acidiceleris]|uniref:DUF5063 domain-containing protein n=1 Tax=Gottfriedia acidiceleris TaxID=371036 RepID=UPI003D23922F
MVNKEINEFYLSALNYCKKIENFNSNKETNKFNNLLASLLDLYSKALYLPEVEAEDTEVAILDFAIPKLNFGQNEYYWDVFEPYQLEEPVCGCGSLSDDILDIYKDVKEGNLLYDQNEQLEAIWHWKFDFHAHWGRHAVNAIRALHSINFN